MHKFKQLLLGSRFKLSAATGIGVLVLLNSLSLRAASFTFNWDGPNVQSGSINQTLQFSGVFSASGLTADQYYLIDTWSVYAWYSDAGGNPASYFTTSDPGVVGTKVPPGDTRLVLNVKIESTAPVTDPNYVASALLKIGGTVYDRTTGNPISPPSTAGDIKDFQITVVPEPYQYGLIAVMGMLGFGGYHRLSRKEV
jgi:hypothetical protein